MKREDVEHFLNKKVYIICEFSIGKPIFYTGTVLTINDDSIVINDKYNNRVAIALGSIKKVEEEQ